MKITVYVRRGCAKCQKTIFDMVKKNVAFDLIDISTKPEIAASLKNDGHVTLPVVIVDDGFTVEGWCGFQPDLIDQL